MLWGLIKSKSDKYDDILKNIFSKKNLQKEVLELSELLKNKNKIDYIIISNKYPMRDFNNLREILDKILTKLKAYQRVFVYLEKVSNNFKDDNNHSSHLFLNDLKKYQESTGITFLELIRIYEEKISYIDKKDIESYIKSEDSLNKKRLETLFPKILNKKPNSINILAYFMALFAIGTAGVLYSEYNIAISKAIFNNKTVIEENFEKKTGVPIYSEYDDEVKLIYEVVNNVYGNLDFLKKAGVRRIFIQSSVLFGAAGGGSNPLLDEIRLGKCKDINEFIKIFFHEFGHQIHANLKNRDDFEKEIKLYFNTKEAQEEVKDMLDKYYWFDGDYKINEPIAHFYSIIMSDIYFYFQKHGKIPDFEQIIKSEKYKDKSLEQKDLLINIIKIFHKYGFFPPSFKMDKNVTAWK